METVTEIVGVEAAELTTADRAQLGRYEAVIRRGLDTFVEVGNALAAIRDDKLYRGTHGTFEDYYKDRWGLGRSQVYRLMDAAEVAGNLGESSPMGEVTERVIRPLTALEPDQQRQAWANAIDDANGGKVTTAHVERAVERLRPAKPTPTPELAKPTYVKPEPTEPSLPTDAIIADLLEASTITVRFSEALAHATIDQLKAALHRISPDMDKWRYLKIGNRRELLLTAKGVAEMTAPIDEPAKPDLPADLIEAGVSISLQGQSWRYAVPSSSHGVATGYYPTREEAIASARETLRLRQRQSEPAKPAPWSDRFERDMDAYDAEAQREADGIVAEFRAEQAAQPDPIPHTSQLNPDNLLELDPASDAFDICLSLATLDQIKGAWAYAPSSEVLRRAKLRARRDELVAASYAVVEPPRAEPDPRLTQAQDGIAAINGARIWVRDNYHELTGCDTDTLAFWRDTAMMVMRLESLVNALERKEMEPNV